MTVSIVYDKSELRKIHGALLSILVGQAHYYLSLIGCNAYPDSGVHMSK